MKLNRKLIIAILVVSVVSTAYGVVFADSISSAVQSIVNRIAIAFDNIGNNTLADSEQSMSGISEQTKSTVNDMVNKSQTDLANDLDSYKNAQIDKKNQEIDAMLSDTQNQINQKKAAKLSEYKQKIDDSIDKEYDKLVDDLMKNN